MLNLATVSNHVALYIAFFHKEYPNLSNIELICGALYLYGYENYKKDPNLFATYQDLFNRVNYQKPVVSIGITSHYQENIDISKFEENATIFEKYLGLILIQFTADFIFFTDRSELMPKEIVFNVTNNIQSIFPNITSGLYFINNYPNQLNSAKIETAVTGISNNTQFFNSIQNRSIVTKEYYHGDKSFIDLIDTIKF
jgi:hypothetical protein